MKKQIVAIHGGDTFETYEEWMEYLKTKPLNFERISTPQQYWKTWLREGLGEEYEVVLPEMPNKQNAKYAEWKIWFETTIPFLNEEVLLIGHSLGGIFLAKYLAEHTFPKKIRALFLVAAPFDHADADYSLADFVLPSSLNKVMEQAKTIFLYHSENDPIVPFADLEKYAEALPTAVRRAFKDLGHFNTPEFPEIVKEIKNIY